MTAPGLVALSPSSESATVAFSRKARLLFAALVFAGACAASLVATCREIAAAPAAEDLANGNVTVAVNTDHIRWGEDIEVTASAVNSTGTTLSGGLYVSFDDDVLVLDVKGGKLLRPGDTLFNLKTATSQVIVRPAVEAWEDGWKAGAERRVVVRILPLARERLRILARATFLSGDRPPKVYISPARIESRSLDEAGFPSAVGYLMISQHASLRRALRRFEQRVDGLDDAEQRRFASALAAALREPKALGELLQDTSNPDLKKLKEALLIAAPEIAKKLTLDPIDALDNLRCLMVNLNCRRALVYFGMPFSVYAALTAEQVARGEAAKDLAKEPGGDALIALLEADGLPYRRDASGAVAVQFQGKLIRSDKDRPLVKDLLDKLVAVLGPAADKTYPEVNGMSFARLRAQLSNATGGAGTPR